MSEKRPELLTKWRISGDSGFFVNKFAVGNSLQYFSNNQRKSLVDKDNMKLLCLNMNLCFEYVSE